MVSISTITTGGVAALHVYIMALEMFLWTTPRGRRSFGLTAEFAEQTKVLAANQGLYNGFLAAGLVWGLLHPVSDFSRQIQLFFNGTVVVAGLYGGLTASRRILLVQGVPGLIGLATAYFSR